MEPAALAVCVFDAYDEKVVSFFCFFGDSLSGRSAMLADRDVDRRGLVVAAARKLGVLGGRLHGFLDAIARLLLVMFAGGLVPTGQRNDRDRNAAGAGQESRETRRELAVRTLIHSEQHAFEIRNEALGLEFLTFQPLLLRLAQRHPRQRPAQHRRHGHGGHERHGNDHGEEILAHAPIDSPIVAMITSVEPRAFMPQASAKASRRVSPPISPPMNAPANLPKLAIAISPTVRSKSATSRRTVRSVESPAMPRKTGMKNARIRPRSCSSMCLLRIGDSPISTPATKAPSTVCTPMKCVVSAITPMITRIIVITGKSLSKLSFVHRIRK